jgi:hypothetical protein
MVEKLGSKLVEVWPFASCLRQKKNLVKFFFCPLNIRHLIGRTCTKIDNLGAIFQGIKNKNLSL